MRNGHTGIFLLLGAVLVTAGYLTLRSFGLLVGPTLAEVKAVPAGSQEVAWISTATGVETWNRIVEAARRLEQRWPQEPALHVDTGAAFPGRSTTIPELALWLEGQPEQKLLIRWYKISSETDTANWVHKLCQRSRPPLAVAGGESTNRAVELGQALEDHQQHWPTAAPLFLITTATADHYTCKTAESTRAAQAPAFSDWFKNLDNQKPLMDLYKGRNFRFSFTNEVMARGVMEFVHEHPELWSNAYLTPAAAAGISATTNVWTQLALIDLVQTHFNFSLYAVAWADDEYSKDLRDRFTREFSRRYHPLAPYPEADVVLHSIGDFAAPSAQEMQAVWRFLNNPERSSRTRQLLVLPVGAAQARRYVRALANSAPRDIRNVVVLSGDSIAFNQIYRDRRHAWNILELPVPLIFFSHRNPVDRSAGFRREGTKEVPWAATGTQDLLFYCDIVEALVLCAYRDGSLAADADTMKERLRQLRWAGDSLSFAPHGRLLFDANRNRQEGTGEHIVWLQPHRDGSRILPKSTISVWHKSPQPNDSPAWRMYGESLRDVLYSCTGEELDELLEQFGP